MKAEFYKGNRQRLYAKLPAGSMVAFFSGRVVLKTNDEFFPFFADRSFVYLTGLDTCVEAVLLAAKDADGSLDERIYILPPDPFKERWTGTRVKPPEAEAISGCSDIRFIEAFQGDFRKLALCGNYGSLYLDLYKVNDWDADRQAHEFLKYVQAYMPFIQIGNANALIRELRLIKQPCEIEALKYGEKITGEGILAMMRASHPGMYEYQYKAEFDRALQQYKAYPYGFPPIISAGRNNFCIHYYSYTGQAQDGDMILNDVGVSWDNLITDVSRGWPCNGRFTDRQRILYECALATSDHLFEIVKPGMRMEDVDKTIHAYCGVQLMDAGLIQDLSEERQIMWHNGAHHIGFDVHDVVATPEIIGPNMAFCIDVGVYYEAWGIGFRIEDNCLTTEDGCINLSAGIPRTIEDIESVMND